MRHIQSFDSYNESFKSILTGGALLLSLLTNQVKGQESKKDLKIKAEMSKFDSNGVKRIEDSIKAKKFELISSQIPLENNFIVSSGTGITKKDAIDRALDDLDLKIKFLGREGAKSIWIYEESRTFHAVIITEILKPLKKHNRGMYDPQLNIYR